MLSRDDYFQEPIRTYAAYLDTEDDILEMVDRADAGLAAGRYKMVSTLAESRALHEAAIARLRTRLAEDTLKIAIPQTITSALFPDVWAR